MQSDLLIFAAKVAKMRMYQSKWLKYRASQDKANMLKYQNEVDKLLIQIHARSKDGQIEIFK